MKCIIAGSRNINNYNILLHTINKYDLQNNITEIVSGNAKGVDQLGIKYANDNNIKLIIFNANWNKYNRSAGPIRNEDMVIYTIPNGCLLTLWNGSSKGTKNIISIAKRYKLKNYNVICKDS